MYTNIPFGRNNMLVTSISDASTLAPRSVCLLSPQKSYMCLNRCGFVAFASSIINIFTSSHEHQILYDPTDCKIMMITFVMFFFLSYFRSYVIVPEALVFCK